MGPGRGPGIERDAIQAGFIVAAADVALRFPRGRPAPPVAGTVEAIWVAGAAAAPARLLARPARSPAEGLEGDRHVAGTGTFPSGTPGSALTLIEAEVCESFEPPLAPGEHRRNSLRAGST